MATVRIAVALVTTAALALPAAATAARLPTSAERTAIVRALPADFRAVPASCVRLRIRVSTSGRWARATPFYLNATTLPCSRFASNGFWILERSPRWTIAYEGSDPPPCSLEVPHGLARCIAPTGG